MPAYKLSRFTDRATLGAINPARLRDFLLLFADYFAVRKFAVAGDILLDDEDYTKLTRILNSPTRAMPSELIEALFHIEEMSNDQGMESLILASLKAGIPLPDDEELTPADLSLHLWMSNPEMLRRSNYERIATSQKSFRHYLNRHRTKPAFALPANDVVQAIQAAIARYNKDRRRGGGTAVWMHDLGEVVAFVIRRGESLKRGEYIVGESCKFDVRRPAGYDTVLYHKSLGELHVHAGLIGEHRCYCSVFGTFLFSDAAFFPASEIFDLEPLHLLGEDIESPGMIDGLLRVCLEEVREVLMGVEPLTRNLKSKRVFPALNEHRLELTPHSRITMAKFRFWLEGNIEVTATIYSGNIVTYSKQVGLDVIEAWMIHHEIKKTGMANRDPNTSSALENALSNPSPASTSPSLARRTG